MHMALMERTSDLRLIGLVCVIISNVRSSVLKLSERSVRGLIEQQSLLQVDL